MKIIGILTGWGCQNWIEPAIKQGLKYTDELHVCISAHSDSLLKFEDETYNIAKKYESDIHLFKHDHSSYHSVTKANILNRALVNSKYMDAGNWIWVLDVDEFYKQDSFDYVKKIIASDICDMICFEGRFFYINTKHYLISEHNRLFKIHNHSCRFYPTQQWPYVNKMIKVPLDLGMYHYSMMQNPHMKMEFWKTEYSHKQDHKVIWLDKIYRNYNLNDEDAWLRRNKALVGNPGPWISDSFKPDENGRLFKYTKKHPSLVEETGLTKVEDFRKYWRF